MDCRARQFNLMSQQVRPIHKSPKQLRQILSGVLVNELSVCIKFILSKWDYDLRILDLNSFTFAGISFSVSWLNKGIASISKTSIVTLLGSNSSAARNNALLYEPFLRLPAKLRIFSFLFPNKFTKPN